MLDNPYTSKNVCLKTRLSSVRIVYIIQFNLSENFRRILSLYVNVWRTTLNMQLLLGTPREQALYKNRIFPVHLEQNSDLHLRIKVRKTYTLPSQLTPHPPHLLLTKVPFEIPLSCSSPASIVLWSIIYSFISLFLPYRLHNCKVSELHSGSSIFGFRHVHFPDRLRFGLFAQSNIVTSDNHQFHSTPKSQTFPTERT